MDTDKHFSVLQRSFPPGYLATELIDNRRDHTLSKSSSYPLFDRTVRDSNRDDPSGPLQSTNGPHVEGDGRVSGSGRRSNSSWDNEFFSSSASTPTPRPPPRMAPIPKSPPPESPIPSTSLSTLTCNSSPGADTKSERSKYRAQTMTLGAANMFRSRLASSTAFTGTHSRSISFCQPHSNLGTNVFANSPATSPTDRKSRTTLTEAKVVIQDENGVTGKSANEEGSWVDLGGCSGLFAAPESRHRRPLSISHMPPTRGPNGVALGLGDHGSLGDHTERPTAFPFTCVTSDTSMPGYSLDGHNGPSQTTSQTLLTPSSSQSCLFSGLPSPMARAFPSGHSIQLERPASMLLSMSASLYPDQGTQAESGAADGLDILEAPLLTLNGLAQPTLNARCEGEGLSSLSSSSSSSGLRVVYPGLRNTIGPYKLIRLLGRGSYSEVQLAADTRTGVHVAIKIMNKSMIQSSDRLGTSVRRESELLKMIRHPNIIRFREVVETSAQTCIVLDYASGGELYNYVSEKRAQAKEEDIQTIFAQITDAVAYLHDNNIVHRDLKLENILLESRAQYPLRPKTKLTDFGLAKVIDSQTPLLTTRCGSEDYAAPEIILGQPYEGSQADVWSLGVILYALLIGFLPFNRQVGMTRKMFLNMIARAEFGFPGEVVMTSKRASMLDLYSVSLAAGSGSTSAQCIASLSPGSGSRSTMTGMETLAVESCSSASLANTGHRVGESCSSVESSGKDMINTPVSATPSETDLPPPPQATNYMTFKVPKMNGVQAVSEESMALVRRILQPQGVKRPSARELLHLDWVSTGQRILADM